MRQKVLIGMGLLLALGVVVWAVVTVPEAPAQKPLPEGPKLMTYDNNTLSAEQNGRTLWELTAEHTEVDVDTRRTELRGITGHFYAEDGGRVDIKAEQGHYDDVSKNIKLTGHIEVENSEGARLTSDELEWLAKEEILAASGKARVTKDDMLGSGDRIESSDAFNKFKISGHAHLEKGKETARKLEEEKQKARAAATGRTE